MFREIRINNNLPVMVVKSETGISKRDLTDIRKLKIKFQTDSVNFTGHADDIVLPSGNVLANVILLSWKDNNGYFNIKIYADLEQKVLTNK